MTEKEIRQKVVDVARGYLGAKKGSPKHKKIVDTYNSQKLLPQGYKLKYTDHWCAGSVTAWSMLAGSYDIIPAECSCGRMITKAKSMGIWVEDDAYTPKIGDFVLYDWDDNGKGDRTGDPEHVGLVEAVVGKNFMVIEGNMGSNSVVGERKMQINGRYIRGFITPNYRSLKTTVWTRPAAYLPALRRGDKGGYVVVLQTLLNLRGQDCGEVDGDFGEKTERAVKQIHSTGVVDAVVWNKLLRKEEFD